jgi:hypothetical protein
MSQQPRLPAIARAAQAEIGFVYPTGPLAPFGEATSSNQRDQQTLKSRLTPAEVEVESPRTGRREPRGRDADYPRDKIDLMVAGNT